MRILITGATGCVAQYITRALLAATDAQLVLVSRDAARIPLPPGAAGRVTRASGDIADPDSYGAATDGLDAAILVATAWGGPNVHAATVTGNSRLADRAIAGGARHVVYFASASVMLPDGSLNPAAAALGTEYIRAKHTLVPEMEAKRGARISGIFPTLVMGGRTGADPMPLSELARLLNDTRRWHGLLARIGAPGRFNIIHAGDIAEVVVALLAGRGMGAGPERHILGLPPRPVEAWVAEMLAAAGRRHRPLVRLTPARAEWAIRAFRVQAAEWDRWCIANPDQGFEQAISPASFGGRATPLTEGLRAIGW